MYNIYFQTEKDLVTTYEYSTAPQVLAIAIFSEHTWNIKTQINESENEVMYSYQTEDSRLGGKGNIVSFIRVAVFPR